MNDRDSLFVTTLITAIIPRVRIISRRQAFFQFFLIEYDVQFQIRLNCISFKWQYPFFVHECTGVGAVTWFCNSGDCCIPFLCTTNVLPSHLSLIHSLSLGFLEFFGNWISLLVASVNDEVDLDATMLAASSVALSIVIALLFSFVLLELLPKRNRQLQLPRSVLKEKWSHDC